mmetsp:Transcript_10318/g.20683  ORF Transcript_10318/g.20683 Transcript_10318/m.20683 type:complete len:482 (+) Transcript_10318:105-1550(+)
MMMILAALSLSILACAVGTTTTTTGIAPFTSEQCKGRKLKAGQKLEVGEAICRRTRSGKIFQLGIVPTEGGSTGSAGVGLQSQKKRDCGDRAVCTHDGYTYCAGDQFYDTSCMPNKCRCSGNGGVPCTKIACFAQCQSDGDCTATVRSSTAQDELYPLCGCEARSTADFIANRYDECLGEDEDNGIVCKAARCMNTCKGRRAICDEEKKCMLVETQCPTADESCMNENNYNACIELERQGCTQIVVLESCPLQFGCGDWADSDGQVSTGGTLHLLRISRRGDVKVIWSLKSNDQLIEGRSLRMHRNGNLAFYGERSESSSSDNYPSCMDDEDCPAGDVCVHSDPSCDPDCGDENCEGECRKEVDNGFGLCGGIAGFSCPEGSECVDAKGDSCSPSCGGADCGGNCVSSSQVPSGNALTVSGEIPVWETGCVASRGSRLVIANVKRLLKRRQTVVKTTQSFGRNKNWYIHQNGRETNTCRRR